jgi:hypothetical protein
VFVYDIAAITKSLHQSQALDPFFQKKWGEFTFYILPIVTIVGLR